MNKQVNSGIFLLIGSNIGDRLGALHRAIENLNGRVGKITKTSLTYETAPWGNLKQNNFLNQVLQIETQLSPAELLHTALAIEVEMGRIREQKWGPRIIDIDILMYDQMTVISEELTIPHPAMHLRRFTLVPLAEIAGDVMHPVLEKTIATLLEECGDEQAVNVYPEN